MQKKRGYFVKGLWAAILAGTFCWTQIAKAGWGGLINGAGFGNSWVSVSHTGTGSKVAQTPGNVQSPSDTVPPNAAYTYKNTAPTGASAGTYSHSKGLPGGIWQNSLVFQPGDGNDNLELQARVNVVPVTCGALSMDSSIDINEFNGNGHCGKITINTHATGGTALWLRGFEYTGDPNLIPPDDPTTAVNESIEFLKANGVWKFETVLLGPFDFGDGSCPLIIPFCLDSGDLKNLWYASDGVGASVPFTIQCPSDVTASCGSQVQYPPVTVSGGCGASTLSFSPANGSVFPVGTTPVTATATDESGNTVSCGFNVIVGDNTAPVPPVLPDIVSNGCNPVQKPPPPVATDNCAGSVLGTTTTQFPITAFGTNFITWKFDDGHGNVSTATQNVIITGPTLVGFYAPISGINGGCGKNQQIEVINPGSKNPIKFDLKCGNTLITTVITPQVRIDEYNGCTFVKELIVTNAVYQNDWHYNWDTTGFPANNYQIFVD